MIRIAAESLIALGKIAFWLCGKGLRTWQRQQPRQRLASLRVDIGHRLLLLAVGAAFYVMLVVVQAAILLAFLPIPLAVIAAVLLGTLVARYAAARVSKYIVRKV